MSPTTELTRDSIAAVDSTGQLADVLGLPEHLRDALWRVESANLSPEDSPGGLVVAAMGGSAIGGLLARAALGDRASRPIIEKTTSLATVSSLPSQSMTASAALVTVPAVLLTRTVNVAMATT